MAKGYELSRCAELASVVSNIQGGGSSHVVTAQCSITACEHLSESQQRTGRGCGESSENDMKAEEIEGEFVREANGKTVMLSRPAAAHKSKMAVWNQAVCSRILRKLFGEIVADVKKQQLQTLP